MPEDKREISVEELLSHTSGIPRHYKIENVDVANRDEVMGLLLKCKLSIPGGARHEYSNANYFLLAAILETVAKQSYEVTIRETVFKPMGMKTAGFTGDQLANGEVSPLRYQDGTAMGTMANWPHTWGHRGATGMLCSVDDLHSFAEALHTDKFFNDTERKDWLTVRKSHYSLGWSVLALPNLPRTIIHGGSASGARSILAYFPDHNATLVVLLNSADANTRHEWAILRAVSATLQSHANE